MILTERDKQILTSWGYKENDIDIIERRSNTCMKFYARKSNKEMSELSAIRRIGREEFLSGIARCAFHWTAMRGKEGYQVYFELQN